MLKNLALIAVSLFVFVLLAEGGLRIAGVSYPTFYQEDPDLGGVLRPGVEGRFRAEGGSWIRVNRDGMRDQEHSIAKPPGTFRIAVLGDSFTEAMPVAEDKAFWAVMGRQLERCAAGKKIEVLNFGVSGYGTAQELIMLRKRVWKFNPDLVLLAFFSGNDVRNNSRVLNHDPTVPYFTYRDGQLVPDDSFRGELRSLKLSPRALALSNFMASVRNHSRLLQMVSEARKATVKASAAKENMAASEKSAAAGGEAGLDNAVYAEPATADWKEAWDITERLIVAMRDEVHSHVAEFTVVTLSTGIQVHPDSAVRKAFMERLKVPDLFYPDRRVRDLCEREHIAVITLAPEMADYAQAHHILLHGFPNAAMGFGHWNETGNRVAGERIAAPDSAVRSPQPGPKVSAPNQRYTGSTMPEFNSTQIGRLEYLERDVVDFPAGLPGFEQEKKFLAVDLPPSRPMILLQSLTSPNLCFMTLPVEAVDTSYRLSIAPEDLKLIGLPGDRQPAIGADALVLVVLSVAQDQPPTANLLAPLVINPKTNQGVQAIQAESGYSHRYELMVPAEEPACS